MTFIIISAIMVVLNVAGVAWVMLHYVPRQLRSFAEIQERWQEIEALCVDLVAEGTVQRALVIKLSNGGGEPTPGTQYYATAMVNVTSDGVRHHPITYKAIEVDAAYVELVIKTRREKRIYLLVDIMQPQMIKEFYEKEGIKYAEWNYLLSTHKATYFCTFATFDENNLQAGRGDMARTVSDIRKLLKKAHTNAK